MPRVVLISTARFTFAVDTARERTEDARALLTQLGAEVVGPETMVMNELDVTAAAPYVEAGDADLVINVCATFADATPAMRLYRKVGKPVVLWAFREPGRPGDRLWLNSLCGAILFAHSIVRDGGDARLVYGNPDEPEVREVIRAALAGDLPPVVTGTAPAPDRPRAERSEVDAALETLRSKTIGLIGDPPSGYTPCEYDPELLARLFGPTIRQITVEESFWRVRDADPRACEVERAAACGAQPSLCALDPAQVGTHASITTGLRDWAEAEGLDAIALRCWPEYPTHLGAAPCSSLSRLADAGITTACERDVYGLTTMLLLEALGSGPSYLVDTVDLDTEANVVRMWHCGSAATSLAADPDEATQDVHCNRRIGVAGNFPLRTGPVVIARLAEDPDAGLRLLIAAGESLPEANRFQGNTAAVRLEGQAGAYVQSLVSGGFPHHVVLAWQDVRPGLRATAEHLGIPVVEW